MKRGGLYSDVLPASGQELANYSASIQQSFQGPEHASLDPALVSAPRHGHLDIESQADNVDANHFDTSQPLHEYVFDGIGLEHFCSLHCTSRHGAEVSCSHDPYRSYKNKLSGLIPQIVSSYYHPNITGDNAQASANAKPIAPPPAAAISNRSRIQGLPVAAKRHLSFKPQQPLLDGFIPNLPLATESQTWRVIYRCRKLKSEHRSDSTSDNMVVPPNLPHRASHQLLPKASTATPLG